MASKRKPASRSKIERLRQRAKPVRRDPLPTPPNSEIKHQTDAAPGRILSVHFGDAPEDEPTQRHVAQEPVKMRWYQTLFARLFGLR